jgi:Ca2+-binding EF-hand superfamily protein
MDNRPHGMPPPPLFHLHLCGSQDGDGVVNKTDWMWGLREYNFPLTTDEANLLFSAIDEDGNGVLTYKEMVRAPQRLGL